MEQPSPWQQRCSHSLLLTQTVHCVCLKRNMEEREREGRGGEEVKGEGRGGVCSAGPRLHTACAGLAFTSTEDHCKLIMALGKHLQTREGSCFSQDGWEHLTGYNSGCADGWGQCQPLPPGGRSPLPPSHTAHAVPSAGQSGSSLSERSPGGCRHGDRAAPYWG